MGLQACDHGCATEYGSAVTWIESESDESVYEVKQNAFWNASGSYCATSYDAADEGYLS